MAKPNRQTRDSDGKYAHKDAFCTCGHHHDEHDHSQDDAPCADPECECVYYFED